MLLSLYFTVDIFNRTFASECGVWCEIRYAHVAIPNGEPLTRLASWPPMGPRGSSPISSARVASHRQTAHAILFSTGATTKSVPPRLTMPPAPSPPANIFQMLVSRAPELPERFCCNLTHGPCLLPYSSLYLNDTFPYFALYFCPCFRPPFFLRR